MCTINSETVIGNVMSSNIPSAVGLRYTFFTKDNPLLILENE